MSGQLITWLVVAWGAIGVAMIVLQLLGAISFDFLEIRAERHFRRHPHARRYRRRPFISVIVATHNDEATIMACLESVLGTKYRKYEVIVVDQASTDNTKRLVRQVKAAYPKLALQLVARRSKPDVQGSLNYVLRRAKGEFIFLLEADVHLAPDALPKAAWRTNLQACDAWLPLKRFSRPESVNEIFQHYAQLLSQRSLKLRSAWQLMPRQAARTVLMRRESLEQILQTPAGNLGPAHLYLEDLRTTFAPDILLTSPPPKALSRWFMANGRQLARQFSGFDVRRKKLQTLPLLLALAMGNLFKLAAPLVLTYFLYLAIHLHQPTFLLVVWGALIAALVAAAWGDEQLKLRQKLTYLLGMPLSFIFFYLATFGPLLRSGWRLWRHWQKLQLHLLPAAIRI